MRNRYVIACALIACCATAQASTVWTGTNFRVDVSSPVPVGGGLLSVTLTAVGLNGAMPNAFDGITGGATGITTNGNLLAQITEFAPLGATTPTLTLAVPGNSIYQPIDTHFLVEPPAIISTVAPTETANVATSAVAPFTALGDSLTGQFALSVAPAVTWNLAQVVTPAGSTVHLNFRLASGVGQFPNELVQTAMLVPEPSSLALWFLGVATYLVVRRRRRHNAGSAR